MDQFKSYLETELSKIDTYNKKGISCPKYSEISNKSEIVAKFLNELFDGGMSEISTVEVSDYLSDLLDKCNDISGEDKVNIDKLRGYIKYLKSSLKSVFYPVKKSDKFLINGPIEVGEVFLDPIKAKEKSNFYNSILSLSGGQKFSLNKNVENRPEGDKTKISVIGPNGYFLPYSSDCESDALKYIEFLNSIIKYSENYKLQ